MEILDEHVALRRKMNEFYKEVFSSYEGITVFSEPDDRYKSNHWLSVINIPENLSKEFNRETLRIFLEKENIESRPLWKPMHLQPVFKDTLFFGRGVSENLFKNGLCLPSGSNLTDSERGRIKESIEACLINY